MTIDWSKKYGLWPNLAFPFSLWFESKECRIFIIENFESNLIWLSKYHKYFKVNDYFFVYLGWYVDGGTASNWRKLFESLSLDSSKFIFMANSEEELFNLKVQGGFSRVDLINHNAWLDWDLYKIKEVRKSYDAIYVGRRSAFKRHMLASEVKNLAVVAGNNHGNNLSPVPAELAYINSEHLSLEKVVDLINQSHCGLILSDIEGACFASSEYILCGIPVVSTYSKGGRDYWYDSQNSIIVNADVESISKAVAHFNEMHVNPHHIRDSHIEKAKKIRLRFIDILSRIFDESHCLGVDPNKVFAENYINKLRSSHRPNFRDIFL